MSKTIEIEPGVLRATAREYAETDKSLEADACTLMKKYGWALPEPAKAFFRKLATHLNWYTLKGIL